MKRNSHQTRTPQKQELPIMPAFELPAELEATAPPEARGLRRDQVRLMVSRYGKDHFSHDRFENLPDHLQAGDLLVVNTSATLPAALDVRHADGRLLRLHVSSRILDHLWVVELRTPLPDGSSEPFAELAPGDLLDLQGTAMQVLRPYRYPSLGHRVLGQLPASAVEGMGAVGASEWLDLPAPEQVRTSERLWLLWVKTQQSALHLLQRHGRPIRYGYVRRDWPLQMYQTLFATEPGSAEMPSAGRAFTPQVLNALTARGVEVLPLTLHTGVASLEAHEAPYEEYYRIPTATAQGVMAARAAGRRVIAVGTTVVRALESATQANGELLAGEDWTALLITPERGLQTVDGLLTGFHEPAATHLAMLQALAGNRHIARAYDQALSQRYLWHEFGDLHLILP